MHSSALLLMAAVLATTVTSSFPITLFEVPTPAHDIRCVVHEQLADCTLRKNGNDTEYTVTATPAPALGHLVRLYRNQFQELHSCTTERTEIKLYFLYQTLVEEAISPVLALFDSRLRHKTDSEELEKWIHGIVTRCTAQRRVEEHDRVFNVNVGVKPPVAVVSSPPLPEVATGLSGADVAYGLLYATLTAGVACFIVGLRRWHLRQKKEVGVPGHVVCTDASAKVD